MLTAKTIQGSGTFQTSVEPLGKGGEGSVYSILDHNIPNLPPAENLVYKKYHNPDEGNRRNKIIAMLKNVPKTRSVAWPLAIVQDDGMFSGYLMRKLDNKNYRMWSELSNMRDRKQSSPEFSFQYALAACRNLSTVLDSIHKAGHCVGDINESNIFVGADASILIVDTDSAQIDDGKGNIYPCLVGKPEYVAPEISHGSFKNKRRTIETDMYAYSVAVTQMLTGGAHPTDGAYMGSGETPDTIQRNREGIYPVLQNVQDYESLSRIPSECIPAYVKKVLLLGLSIQPNKRPSFKQFTAILDNVSQNLVKCTEHDTHHYDGREYDHCCWCSRLEKNLIDPWSNASPVLKDDEEDQQMTLPKLSFNDGSSNAPTVRRAAVNTGNNVNNKGFSQQFPNNVQQSSGSQNGMISMNSGGIPMPDPDPEPEIPDKIKGKTVLKYTDGSWEVRPPLSKLFASSPSTAIYCLKKEFPDFLSIWWKVERPVASRVGLFLGLLFGLLLSGSLYFVPIVVQYFWNDLPSFVYTVLPYASYGMIILAALSVFYLFFSGFTDYFKAWKVNKNMDNYKREPFWSTAVRFLPLPYFFGIFGLLFLVFFILSLFAKEIREDARRNAYR